MSTATQSVSAASSPRMSRRHAAGAESARGLLFTILGEFVLPTGGAAWTAAFIETMSRLDVEEKATRQALMRTAADGWLMSERVGRRTLWRLTPNAERLLTEGSERIYGFGDRIDWDGSWLLVLARAPETERPARHVLRTRLTWVGFGSPAPGVWVSTHAERLGEVERVLREAGLSDDAQIFRGTHVGGGQLETMVRQAWDLAAIEASYDEFLAAFSGGLSRDPLTSTIELVHAWRRFPSIDPGLPRQLLPKHWSGVKAARLFRRRHTQWAPAAAEAWHNLGQRS